jgi:hypothetical protein
MKTPDLTQRVVGYRKWIVNDDHELCPIGYTEAPAWKPGPMRAVCYVTTDGVWTPCIPAADPDCECGFYAVHRLEYIESYSASGFGHGNHVIVGIVTAWGRLSVHGRGFRAEYIEVAALISPTWSPKDYSDELNLVANKYNVPVVGHEDAESYASEFGASIPESLFPDDNLAVTHNVTKSSLNSIRKKAVHESVRVHFSNVLKEVLDISEELDVGILEAMAGLYDIYVPNVGDLLLSIVEPPAPTYTTFPVDVQAPMDIDPWSKFSMHLCTNGSVAYLRS